MNQIYNIYCDESRVENRDSKNMAIGALFIPRKEKNRIVNNLKKIYQKYDFAYELKWTKTNKKYKDFYQELIDYFTDEELLNYRCIIVDKTKIKYDEFHKNDPELAFFKFYYLMLRAKLLDQCRYYISLDKKPTRDKNRARALHSFLESYILLNKKDCNIEHFQAYSSDDSLLIQFTDYLTGLFGFACNERDNNSPKAQIVQYLKLKLKRENLCITSPLSESKCNILVWEEKV